MPIDLHEMFKLALWDEHISAAMYSAMAAKTEETITAQKLKYLAADEKRHFEELMEMHRVLCCKEPIVVTDIGSPSAAESGFMARKGTVKMETFLEFTMEKESSAQTFYLNMSEKIKDRKGATTLLFFAAMEADHYNLLKTENDNLRRRKGI